jgi:hydrogenase maturation protease
LTAPALVIGYGNSLRRDDAAGLRVAERVGARLPDVRVVTVHELVPELVDDIASASVVVFTDAAQQAGGGVAAWRLEHDGDAPPLSHVASPRTLLALVAALHDRRPEAWIVTVSAHDLGLGEGLSADTERMIDAAVDEVERIVLASRR